MNLNSNIKQLLNNVTQIKKNCSRVHMASFEMRRTVAIMWESADDATRDKLSDIEDQLNIIDNATNWQAG